MTKPNERKPGQICRHPANHSGLHVGNIVKKILESNEGNRRRNRAKNNAKYKLVLDPQLSAPRFQGGFIDAVKVPKKKGGYVAAIIYKVPESVRTEATKTILYSHGNATYVGAMIGDGNAFIPLVRALTIRGDHQPKANKRTGTPNTTRNGASSWGPTAVPPTAFPFITSMYHCARIH